MESIKSVTKHLFASSESVPLDIERIDKAPLIMRRKKSITLW